MLQSVMATMRELGWTAKQAWPPMQGGKRPKRRECFEKSVSGGPPKWLHFCDGEVVEMTENGLPMGRHRDRGRCNISSAAESCRLAAWATD